MKYLLLLIGTLLLTNLSFSQFQLNGSTVDLGSNTYQLTQALNSQFGAIWYQLQHDLNTDFTVQGQMNFGTDPAGADGIAFVMQQNCLSAGGSGGGLGFSGIAGQSFAVEFDTYRNIVGTGVENNFDPNYDHIAVEKNGDVMHDASADDITAPVLMHNTLTNVKNGIWYPFTISWNATSNNLQVIFDGSTRVNITYDIQADVFSGDQYTYWGFTSTTGGFYNEQQIIIEAETSSMTLSDMTLCPGSIPVSLPSLSSLSGTNLALGNPVVASSGTNAAAVADGNGGTRWESVWGVDPQWIYIDLGVPVDITSVVLVWEGAYATAYQIQTSDDAVTWTTQYSTTTNTGGTNTVNFSASNIRYVRMYGTARSLAPYGYSIWEFGVYGTPNYLWSPDDGTINDIYGESVTITPTATQTYSVLIPDPCLGTISLDFLVTVDCTVLPSELITFNGHLYNDGAILNWVTASEINSDYFDLLRSNDGINFTQAGTVDAAGFSNEILMYSFYDSQRIEPIAYYKLISVDFDGSQKESIIVAITNGDNSLDGATICFSNESSISIENKKAFSYSIYDITGKLIETHLITEDETSVLVGKSLSQGNYFLQLNCSAGTEIIRLLKTLSDQ